MRTSSCQQWCDKITTLYLFTIRQLLIIRASVGLKNCNQLAYHPNELTQCNECRGWTEKFEEISCSVVCWNGSRYLSITWQGEWTGCCWRGCCLFGAMCWHLTSPHLTAGREVTIMFSTVLFTCCTSHEKLEHFYSEQFVLLLCKKWLQQGKSHIPEVIEVYRDLWLQCNLQGINSNPLHYEVMKKATALQKSSGSFTDTSIVTSTWNNSILYYTVQTLWIQWYSSYRKDSVYFRVLKYLTS